jgi:hypothetical protein
LDAQPCLQFDVVFAPSNLELSHDQMASSGIDSLGDEMSGKLELAKLR